MKIFWERHNDKVEMKVIEKQTLKNVNQTVKSLTNQKESKSYYF